MIRIKNLNIHLKDFNLFDINLDIGRNEFFVLMGPTGAGKTVLLEAIAGLIPTKSGIIHIGEKNVTGLAPEKRGVSIVYQDYSLFPHLTVRENMRYGLHFHRIDKNRSDETFDRLVENLNLSHILNRFPLNLSGGELQRVSMARAMMVDPEILLLDEPYLGLAPILVKQIFDIIREINEQGTSILLIEQNAHKALSIATRGYVLENGHISASGSASELKSDEKIREAYLGGTALKNSEV